MSMSHKEVRGHRWPLRTTAPLPSEMVTVEAVYRAERPLSHKRPIDSREPTHWGKMSTLRAAMGSAGRLSTPVCVDTAMLPSGKRTRTGLLVACTLRIIC